MLPVAPQPRRSFRDFAMPSLKLFRRRQALPASASSFTPSEHIELGATRPELDIERIQSGDSKRFSSQPAASSDEAMPQLEMEVDDQKKEMIRLQRDYEDDMKKFDRIEWAEIHLKHATVSHCISGRAIADANHRSIRSCRFLGSQSRSTLQS
jgi:hypothetical protein